MVNTKYSNYIYQINGEQLKSNPDTIFDSNQVYLIIDKNLQIIWIWAGSQSKLFHRYIASSWAGKLKSKKEYYNYTYELIKQGRENEDFITIINEINEGRMDLNYPGESRALKIDSKKISLNQPSDQLYTQKISTQKVSAIKSILSEIKEMQMHVQYSMEHIGKRIKRIEEILEK
ncbi:MAG: hypothetical protein BAJALOKI1v1_50015 [Promethearchaeota archaeon]|nr:MAG: hypothetical protein BAJALOKI1v1_50015 [Candidatus Lokiarchaeota archaeon]